MKRLRVLSTMAIQQGERMRHLGLNFDLDDETSAAFYRHLVGEAVGSGYAVLSVLTSARRSSRPCSASAAARAT